MKRIVYLSAVLFSLSALALVAGPASVTDFGQVAMGSTTSLTVAIPLTPAQLALAKQCAVHYGIDFSAGACSSIANGVSLKITFQPKYAGLRQDAVIVKDGSGNLVAEAFLHGIGNGPMAAFRPGVIRPILPMHGTTVTYSPWGLVADRENGFAYIAERNQSVVWQTKPDGTAAIYAGTPNPATQNSGDGGLATAATINPQAMALDPAGNLFIVSGGTIVRRVDSVTGIITTFAGGGTNNGDGGLATAANLPDVTGLAVDAVGNLYLAVGTIRKVDAVTGIITTVAGSTTAVQYGDGGPATQAALGAQEIAFDSVGNLYVTCPTPWATIRKIDAQTGIISTVAGIPFGTTENADQDGVPATSVGLYYPSGIAVDAAGDVYFGNTSHVRKVSAATGLVTSLNDGDASLFTIFAGQWTSLNGYSANMSSEIGYFSIDGAGNLFTPTMEIERDEGTLFFAQTSVGQTSVGQNLTIENIGNQTMQVASTQVSANFKVSGNCGGAMAAGQECALSISFDPGQAGGISGSMTVTDNSLNQAGAQQVSVLRGPWAQVIPLETVVDFGATVPALSEGGPFNFQMQNPGDIAIHLTTVVSGPNASEFTFLNDGCGLAGTSMIAAQNICSSWIMFEPLTAGPKTATLTITNDYDSTVQTITVKGTALAPLLPQVSFSQNSIYFSGPQWQAGGLQTVTITNTGDATLYISKIALQNTADPNLTIYPYTCVVGSPRLQPIQTCQFEVYFSPVNATADSNAIVITDNAGNSPQTIPITVSLTPVPLQFVPVTPCRIIDTRFDSAPFAGKSIHNLAISKAACGIPATAAAYSLNVTAVPGGALSYLSIGPLGAPLPTVSTLNSDGRVKANAAIVGAGPGGGGGDLCFRRERCGVRYERLFCSCFHHQQRGTDVLSGDAVPHCGYS